MCFPPKLPSKYFPNKTEKKNHSIPVQVLSFTEVFPVTPLLWLLLSSLMKHSELCDDNIIVPDTLTRQSTHARSYAPERISRERTCTVAGKTFSCSEAYLSVWCPWRILTKHPLNPLSSSTYWTGGWQRNSPSHCGSRAEREERRGKKRLNNLLLALCLMFFPGFC